ncbi:MAG: UDP-2,3-diacylglucosamine diphosphatase [Cellvibrionaceae bacterium]
MTTFFISDLHLDESRPQVTEAFKVFMRDIAPAADALYILGDFFEVWIGDDDDASFNREIVEILADYTAADNTLFFMVGNRDFLIGDRFAQRTGATLLCDPTEIDLYGTPTLLLHGDSLCTKDAEYMAFRAQARSAEWQQQLLSQPLAARREIARQLRQQSKSMNSLKADDIMDVTPEEVTQVMVKAKTKRMIHGHTHRPARHSVDNISGGERIVLGDWHEQAWWLKADSSGKLELVSRPIDSL